MFFENGTICFAVCTCFIKRQCKGTANPRTLYFHRKKKALLK